MLSLAGGFFRLNNAVVTSLAVHPEQASILPKPCHVGAVKADELVISSIVVRGSDDASPSSLKTPLFANLDQSCFLGYLSVAVIYRPFIMTGLVSDNRFRLIQAPAIMSITKDFSRAEFLFFDKIDECFIHIGGRITRLLFGLNEKLFQRDQNIMG